MPTAHDTEPPRRRVRLLADMEDEFGAPGVTTEDESSAVAKIYFYDEVGGWGVWPDEFQRKLSAITAPTIELHLHSPGGDAFDGIAIYNMLKQHDAKIVVWVDGLAASAASVVAMAGDEIIMAEGSQLMCHDAWGMTVGPAEDMEKMASELDKVSDSIAGIYAARAGGTVKSWRAAMREESWYTGKEAVEAGLATRVEKKKAAAKNRWDLQIFTHAGRDDAGEPAFPGGRKRPAPESPAAAAQRMKAAADARRAALQTPDATPAAGSTTSEEGANMPFDLDKLKDALGLPAEPSALDPALSAFGNALNQLGGTATPPAAAAPTTPPATPPADNGPVPPPQMNAAARESGAVLLDPDTLRKLQESATKGETAWAQMKRNERDAVIRDAIDRGKFPPEREEYWKQLWDRDPDGTRASIEQLASNVIPVLSAGYLGDDSAHRSRDAQAYAGLYGEDN